MSHPGGTVVLVRDEQPLTDLEQQVLDFERGWWKHRGAKEQAVKDLFGLGWARYGQLVNALIDRPEALAYAPTVVKRLRRQRTERQAARSTRRLAG